jgi:hypothetical protein
VGLIIQIKRPADFNQRHLIDAATTAKNRQTQNNTTQLKQFHARDSVLLKNLT